MFTPRNSTGNRSEIVALIRDIKPIEKDDPFSELERFHVPLSFDVPLIAYLDDIDTIFKLKNHDNPAKADASIECIHVFADYFTSAKSKQQAERLQTLMEHGQFSKALPSCIAFEKKEPSNPVAYYIHEQCLDCLGERHEAASSWRWRHSSSRQSSYPVHGRSSTISWP